MNVQAQGAWLVSDSAIPHDMSDPDMPLASGTETGSQ